MDEMIEIIDLLSPGLPYPLLFGELVANHAFLAFDVGEVRMYSNIRGETDSLEELLDDKILTTALTAAGFLPFGRPVTGSYDRVCFDVRKRSRLDDAPIVVMNHEAILSFNKIPKPAAVVDGLAALLGS